MFLRIENNIVVEYPIPNIRRRLPDRSLPADLSTIDEIEGGFFRVYPTDRPEPEGPKRVTEGTPELVNGKWTQVWVVEDLTGADAAAYRERFMTIVAQNVQNRLDVFAKTRNYDTILSATTYVDDQNPRFAAEGAYCKSVRSETWAALYRILDEVLAGEREEPTSYSDIEPLLPTLAWPN